MTIWGYSSINGLFDSYWEGYWINFVINLTLNWTFQIRKWKHSDIRDGPPNPTFGCVVKLEAVAVLEGTQGLGPKKKFMPGFDA